MAVYIFHIIKSLPKNTFFNHLKIKSFIQEEIEVFIKDVSTCRDLHGCSTYEYVRRC